MERQNGENSITKSHTEIVYRTSLNDILHPSPSFWCKILPKLVFGTIWYNYQCGNLTLLHLICVPFYSNKYSPDHHPGTTVNEFTVRKGFTIQNMLCNGWFFTCLLFI